MLLLFLRSFAFVVCLLPSRVTSNTLPPSPSSPKSICHFLLSTNVLRSSFVVSFLSTRGNLERTPLSNCFSIWFPVLGSRFICVRGFCPRGDPFVRQLRIPFVVGNKIGSYKLFLVSIPGTRGSSPFVPSSSNVSVTFPRVHSSPLLFLSFFFFLQPKFLPFVIFLFPVIPVPHLIYCFRSAIINN